MPQIEWKKIFYSLWHTDRSASGIHRANHIRYRVKLISVCKNVFLPKIYVLGARIMGYPRKYPLVSRDSHFEGGIARILIGGGGPYEKDQHFPGFFEGMFICSDIPWWTHAGVFCSATREYCEKNTISGRSDFENLGFQKIPVLELMKFPWWNWKAAQSFGAFIALLAKAWHCRSIFSRFSKMHHLFPDPRPASDNLRWYRAQCFSFGFYCNVKIFGALRAPKNTSRKQEFSHRFSRFEAILFFRSFGSQHFFKIILFFLEK